MYVRRSVKQEGDAEISEAAQLSAAQERLPVEAEFEVFQGLGVSGGSDQRPEYQRMLDWLRQGRLVGIAAYDLSRLHRNTENSLALLRECAARGVDLRAGVLPPEFLREPEGELAFTMQGATAQYEREVIRRRNRRLARTEFEAGGPRGADPFGYGGS